MFSGSDADEAAHALALELALAEVDDASTEGLAESDADAGQTSYEKIARKRLQT
jgi:hypothetical protein